MRPHLVLAVSAVSLTLVLGTAASSRAARLPDATRAVEVRRVRAHFDSVLAELPARDVSALAPAQRARRDTLLATLRAYRDRGEFPHNYDFPGEAVPYFVDRETGVLCAVAHLLATSGRRDIVDRVARADNNVWVPALAGDTAFTAWLDASGLTLAEAARIQVPYVSPEPTPVTAITGRNQGYAAASLLAIGGAVTTSIVNARTNAVGAGSMRNFLGVAAGATALGLGAASLSAEGASPVLGVANAASGVASLWISTRGIVRHRRVLAAAREREASLARRAVITPVIPVGKEGGAGVSVTVPF
jgi:hypothetical protein